MELTNSEIEILPGAVEVSVAADQRGARRKGKFLLTIVIPFIAGLFRNLSPNPFL